MSLPTLLVEADFGDVIQGFMLDDTTNGLLGTSSYLAPIAPTYSSDITSKVRAVSVGRGTSKELDAVQAGTATILLDNRDGRFTPFKASSPYYPNVRPMRRIRIRGTWSATTYPVFEGYVESWPIGFQDEADQTVQVQLVDGYKLLSLANVSGSYPTQSTGARITQILSDAGWTGATAIASGTATVPAITLSNVSVLQHIQDVEYAEGGRFFMSRDGAATFLDRSAAANPDLATRTWADDGSGMSYRDITLQYGDEMILNDVHLTRTGGTEQVSADSTSKQQYGKRSLSKTDVQLSTDSAVLDLAGYLITTYAQPRLRAEGLVDNAMKHGYWDRVLARDLADIVGVVESKTGIAQASRIEGISHELSGGTWTVTLALSPTTITTGFILDDATYGLLNSTAILAR